jgi:hypothetical protein
VAIYENNAEIMTYNSAQSFIRDYSQYLKHNSTKEKSREVDSCQCFPLKLPGVGVRWAKGNQGGQTSAVAVESSSDSIILHLICQPTYLSSEFVI